MTTTEEVVTIAVDLPFDKARAFAQFLKRTGPSNYRRFAKDGDNAYEMLCAGEKAARCAHRGWLGATLDTELRIGQRCVTTTEEACPMSAGPG